MAKIANFSYPPLI